MFEMVAMFATVGLFSAKPGVAAWIYVASWSAYALVVTGYLWRFAPWLFARPLRLRTTVLRELVRPMFGVLAMTFGYVGMSVQAPRIIVAAVAGPVETALYVVASMMMRVVRIPIDLPAHAATVEISLAVGPGEMARGRELLSNTTRTCLWLALASIPFVVALGPLVSSVWTNGRVTTPVDLVALMCVSTIFFAVSLPSQEGLMAIGRLDRATKWLLIGSAPFIALCWGLTRLLGVEGAAIAVIGLDLLYATTAVAAVIRYFEYGGLRRWAARLGPPVDLLFAERDRLLRHLRRSAGE
jgi:O-antigen/teichoic acid export membrane protein